MRRLTITAVLCALGILVYLHWSEGPARVHWATISVQAVYLIAINAVAWLGKLRWKRRVAICIGLAAFTAAVGSYLDGRVIAALSPFHPVYLMLAFLGLLLEGSFFLSAVWLIDRALGKLSPLLNPSKTKYTCPCCGYKTLLEPPPGTFAICPVCFWEDDNVQFEDPDFKGGANQESLREAQANFEKYGASSPRRKSLVRKPGLDESRDLSWLPLTRSK